MKTLIVEDDFTSRLLLQKFLMPFGEAHVAVDGKEAVTAFRAALANQEPYDLVCLDIMIPEMDGQQTLKFLRQMEEDAGITVGHGAKVIMTTAHSDRDNIMTAFRESCDAYLVKPIAKAKLLDQVRAFGLIS